jgi:hypothetical protein
LTPDTHSDLMHRKDQGGKLDERDRQKG